MTTVPLDHLLDTAICAAEAAGNHALNNKHRRTESTETFSHDIKLVLDQECQTIAENMIASEFPDHSILGEEGVINNSSEYEWIIDPIDGTVNYFHGLRYWCCSVAVRRNGTVLAGCVYAPEFKDYYTAHIEQPAKCNGLPINPSKTPRLAEAMIFSGLSKYVDSSSERHFDIFRTLVLNTKKVRINGAAALDLCRVADGTCDGVFHPGIYLWDFAAAGLIAQQAGAELYSYKLNNAQQDFNVISANEHLAPGLRDLYTQHI